MKTKLTLLLAALAAAVASQAVTYRGTITQTIHPFEDRSGWMTQYAQGALFEGFYEYDSDTIDGTFTLEDSLRGTIFLPQPDNELYGTRGEYWELSNTRNPGTLTVANGVVSNFEWTYELGGIWSIVTHQYSYLHLYTDFGYFSDEEQDAEWLQVYGEIAMGAPEIVQPAVMGFARMAMIEAAHVPDGGSVLAGLVTGLAILLAIQRVAFVRHFHP